MEVRAHRTIAASPEALFAFLEEPDRHWQLLGRRLEPLRAYDGERSRVRLRGPLGVRRTLSIRFASAQAPSELVGRVEAGEDPRDRAPRTIGTVRWSIRPAGGAADESAGADAGGNGGVGAGGGVAGGRGRGVGGASGVGGGRASVSEVELTARTEVAGWLDRLLLAAGGARWLRRSLELALERLDERYGSASTSTRRE